MGRVVGNSVGIEFDKTGVLKIPIIEATVEAVRITGNIRTKTAVISRELSFDSRPAVRRERPAHGLWPPRPSGDIRDD